MFEQRTIHPLIGSIARQIKGVGVECARAFGGARQPLQAIVALPLREVRRLHCAGAARPRTPRQEAGASLLNLRAGALPLDPKWKLARAYRLTRMPLVCSGLHA